MEKFTDTIKMEVSGKNWRQILGTSLIDVWMKSSVKRGQVSGEDSGKTLMFID